MSNLEAPGRDLPGDGDGLVVAGAQVDRLELDHDLADDVVPRVAVEAQDHEVKGQSLKEKKEDAGD